VSIAVNTDALAVHDMQTCSSTMDPEPKSKRLRIFDKFDDEDSAADMVAMVTQYLSVNEKESEERSDSFMYWKNSRFADLASLAKTYLTANASSVPCESMFSISGMLLNGRRSSLVPHTFNRLIRAQVESSRENRSKSRRVIGGGSIASRDSIDFGV